MKEEPPERPLIRREEVLKILDQESDISDSWFEPFASLCHTDNDAISRRNVHACLTLSQINATGATHGGSEDPGDDDDLSVVGPQFQFQKFLSTFISW